MTPDDLPEQDSFDPTEEGDGPLMGSIERAESAAAGLQEARDFLDRALAMAGPMLGGAVRATMHPTRLARVIEQIDAALNKDPL